MLPLDAFYVLPKKDMSAQPSYSTNASEEHLQALFSLSAAMQYVAATIFLSGTAGIYCVNTTNQEKGGSQ